MGTIKKGQKVNLSGYAKRYNESQKDRLPILGSWIAESEPSKDGYLTVKHSSGRVFEVHKEDVGEAGPDVQKTFLKYKEEGKGYNDAVSATAKELGMDEKEVEGITAELSEGATNEAVDGIKVGTIYTDESAGTSMKVVAVGNGKVDYMFKGTDGREKTGSASIETFKSVTATHKSEMALAGIAEAETKAQTKARMDREEKEAKDELKRQKEKMARTGEKPLGTLAGVLKVEEGADENVELMGRIGELYYKLDDGGGKNPELSKKAQGIADKYVDGGDEMELMLSQAIKAGKMDGSKLQEFYGKLQGLAKENGVNEGFNDDYENDMNTKLTKAGFDISKLTQPQRNLILQPSEAPENYMQDGELSVADAKINWVENMKKAGISAADIAKAKKINESKVNEELVQGWADHIGKLEKYGKLTKALAINDIRQALVKRYGKDPNKDETASLVDKLKGKGFVVKFVDGTPINESANGNKKEGWMVSNAEDGKMEIQKDDEAGIFKSDAEAKEFVMDKAKAGSKEHQKALKAAGLSEGTEGWQRSTELLNEWHPGQVWVAKSDWSGSDSDGDPITIKAGEKLSVTGYEESNGTFTALHNGKSLSIKDADAEAGPFELEKKTVNESKKTKKVAKGNTLKDEKQLVDGQAYRMTEGAGELNEGSIVTWSSRFGTMLDYFGNPTAGIPVTILEEFVPFDISSLKEGKLYEHRSVEGSLRYEGKYDTDALDTMHVFSNTAGDRIEMFEEDAENNLSVRQGKSPNGGAGEPWKAPLVNNEAVDTKELMFDKVAKAVRKDDPKYAKLKELEGDRKAWKEYNDKLAKETNMTVVYNDIDDQYEIYHKDDPTLDPKRYDEAVDGTKITTEDVKKVAKDLKMAVPTEEQIEQVIAAYPSAQEEDKEANWSLVVEQLLYNVMDEDHNPDPKGGKKLNEVKEGEKYSIDWDGPSEVVVTAVSNGMVQVQRLKDGKPSEEEEDYNAIPEAEFAKKAKPINEAGAVEEGSSYDKLKRKVKDAEGNAKINAVSDAVFKHWKSKFGPGDPMDAFLKDAKADPTLADKVLAELDGKNEKLNEEKYDTQADFEQALKDYYDILKPIGKDEDGKTVYYGMLPNGGAKEARLGSWDDAKKEGSIMGIGGKEKKRDEAPKVDEAATAKTATVRKDLQDDEMGVPVGDTYYGKKDPLEYKWDGDTFMVKLDGKWQEAESVDWEFESKQVITEGAVLGKAVRHEDAIQSLSKRFPNQGVSTWRRVSRKQLAERYAEHIMGNIRYPVSIVD